MADLFTELTEPPIVGRFYWALCVQGVWQDRRAWWPVMGPKHDDTEWIGFRWQHYHLNRFFVLPRDEIMALRRPLSDYSLHLPQPAPRLRLRKCRRSAVVQFPYRQVTNEGWLDMFRHYAGTKCKSGAGGFVCPHKGTPLGAVMPDADGVRTCPLHGLRIGADGVVVEAVPVQERAKPPAWLAEIANG